MEDLSEFNIKDLLKMKRDKIFSTDIIKDERKNVYEIIFTVYTGNKLPKYLKDLIRAYRNKLGIEIPFEPSHNKNPFSLKNIPLETSDCFIHISRSMDYDGSVKTIHLIEKNYLKELQEKEIKVIIEDQKTALASWENWLDFWQKKEETKSVLIQHSQINVEDLLEF